jgi:hypothetical protein
MIEKLALPMFATGILAMIIAASISVSATAVASAPVSYKKVTLNYISSGYSGSSSSCGSYQDSYSSSVWNTPSFSARDSSNSLNQKLITCQATLYVVTGVELPKPTPMPTVTVIYKNSPSSTPRPTTTPTWAPTPMPTVQPSVTPMPVPTWLYFPTATPKPRR